MQVTREEVLHCARLACLQLTEAEIEPLRADMEALLSHAESLQALNLTGIAPMCHGLSIPLPRRADAPHSTFDQTTALANAPEQDQGHFLVPKVM